MAANHREALLRQPGRCWCFLGGQWLLEAEEASHMRPGSVCWELQVTFPGAGGGASHAHCVFTCTRNQQGTPAQHASESGSGDTELLTLMVQS